MVPYDFVLIEIEDPLHCTRFGKSRLKKNLKFVINFHDNIVAVEVAKVKVVFKISPVLKKTMVEQVCRLDVVDREIEDYQKEVRVGCSKYDEDVCEEKGQLEEHMEKTQVYASKEAEFEPICVAMEVMVYEGEYSMPPPRYL